MKDDAALIRYDRRGDLIRVTLTSLTNHELREVLIGLWARLDAADRAAHINELLYYAPMLTSPEKYPNRFLSRVALAIKEGPEGERAIDLKKIGANR